MNSDAWKVFSERIRKARAMDQRLRTGILTASISLEQCFENIIVEHFCPDKTKHLSFTAFVFQGGQIGLANKIEMVRKLLKHSYPDLKDSFLWFCWEADKVRDLRNKFAHHSLVLNHKNPGAVNGVTLRFINSAGEREEAFFEEKIVEGTMARADGLEVVGSMLGLVIQRRVAGNKEGEQDVISVVQDVKKQIERSDIKKLAERMRVIRDAFEEAESL